MKLRAILLLLITFCTAKAQHYSLFSQYVVNGLVINPAYAGRNDVMDITAMHRQQWFGLGGAPITTSFSAHSPLRKKSINVGISVVDDRIGITTNQLISGMYAYRFQAGKFKLSFGVQGGYQMRRINWDALIKNDPNDILVLNQAQSKGGLNFGAGYYMYSDNLFAGVSLPYVMNSFSKGGVSQSPLLFNAGCLYKISEEHTLKPSLLFKYIKGSPMQTDLNLSYCYKQIFGLGFSYRTKESLVAIAEIGISEQLKVCYSYDMGVTKIKKYHNGSHEILIRYCFGYSTHAKNPRAFLN